MKTSSSNSYRKMSTSYNDIPWGIKITEKLSENCCSRNRYRRKKLFKFSVLFLTYIAYTCYHMTRKPISVVKSVLHRNCSGLTPPDGENDNNWCDYAPFDGDNAIKLFGALDSAFLFSYAIAMFVSGFIAERCSIRYFLSGGMILTGIFTYLFGVAKTANIHAFWYFMIIQAIAGIFQTTGWPGVVTVVGRWFGKSKHGLIFGIWNSHTSIGNILGTLIAGHYVLTDWSMSFIVPGFIMAGVGFIQFLFLVDSPELVGCQIQEQPILSNASDIENNDPSIIEPNEVEIISNIHNANSEINYRPSERGLISRANSPIHSNENQVAIGYREAILIPGVIEFSMSLFFSKLVCYTFLFWLPLYIQANTNLDATESADMSTILDIGGIAGAIVAGAISDATSKPATTCAGMFLLAAPTLLLFQYYITVSVKLGQYLLFVLGILITGPYALITTSVSAALGQHSSLEGNAKALATVTAIIDGTGSIGAAIGPLLTGLILTSGWQKVFIMLIASDIASMLLLSRLVYRDYKTFFQRISSTFKRNSRIE